VGSRAHKSWKQRRSECFTVFNGIHSMAAQKLHADSYSGFWSSSVVSSSVM